MNCLVMMAMLISTMLLKLFSQMMEMSKKNKESKMAFECGFDPMSQKKMSFSTNFMMLLMMFLVFDVEISLLTPLVLMNKNNLKTMSNLFNALIIVLTMVMLKEWSQGSLDWNH